MSNVKRITISALAIRAFYSHEIIALAIRAFYSHEIIKNMEA